MADQALDVAERLGERKIAHALQRAQRRLGLAPDEE
jgi:hypothetical protein